MFIFVADPFGGDPFKESDPFKGTSSEDFFKKTDKSDLFGYSDPFGRKPPPPAKVLTYSSSLFCFSGKMLYQCIDVMYRWPLAVISAEANEL